MSTESLEDFYKYKLNWVPESIRQQIGHFNVFRLEPFVGVRAKPVPYSQRDYFKISLIKGSGQVYYADKVIDIQEQALLFANPQIPYKWEKMDKITGGYFCVFTSSFFHQYGNLEQYEVFKPKAIPIYELTDEHAHRLSMVYERMFEELASDYIHKYDVLRNLVFELLHSAMKMRPSQNLEKQKVNASQRISGIFLELLERQFPIDEMGQSMPLRNASDFADQLAIHVNYLNRALKETMHKTTSEVIAERILQEAKILLKHSSWNVSEIAYTLKFAEVTNFNNFFKRHTDLSPTQFRNS